MNDWLSLLLAPVSVDIIAEDLGIGVSYWDDLPCLGVFARTNEGCSEIALRADLQQPCNERLRRVTLAHELGHAALHAGTYTSPLHCHRPDFTASRIEFQAERYAGQLLCPEALVQALCRERGEIGPEEIEELADAVQAPNEFVGWWVAHLAGSGRL
jgi:hypothetical protein